MNDIDWLVGRRFEKLAKREHDWVFQFDDRVSLVAACLWRLVENDCIRVTDKDHEHCFGLPSPVDAAASVNSQLAGALVKRIALRAGTLDLAIEFDAGRLLELFPDSSGYESWELTRPNELFIAAGGGRLDVFIESPLPERP